MSLGVVIKGPEGVVLAADSRVTLEARRGSSAPLLVNFDNATKLLSFSRPHTNVGAVTYGAAVIGLRIAHSFVPEFETKLPSEKPLSVEEFAKKLSAFYSEQWEKVMPPDYSGPPMTFIVGGYNEGDAYGKVFVFSVPNQLHPEPRNPGENEFGMTWGGQLQVASRIVHGYDPLVPEVIGRTLKLSEQQIQQLLTALKQEVEYTIPYQILPLQDCVDLAIFMIRTTITAQGLAVGVRGVGGMIEVATITRTEGLKWVQKKQLHGERGVELPRNGGDDGNV